MLELKMAVNQGAETCIHTVKSNLIDLENKWTSYTHIEDIFHSMVVSLNKSKKDNICFIITLADNSVKDKAASESVIISLGAGNSIMDFFNTLADVVSLKELYNQITLFLFATVIEKFLALDKKTKKKAAKKMIATKPKIKKKAAKKKMAKKKIKK